MFRENKKRNEIDNPTWNLVLEDYFTIHVYITFHFDIQPCVYLDSTKVFKYSASVIEEISGCGAELPAIVGNGTH